MNKTKIIGASIGVVTVLLLIFIWLFCVRTVPAGHVSVATLFGQVQDHLYEEGIHIVNPLCAFTYFDVRQKTHKESAQAPSQDQLMTQIDVSVQYRMIRSSAPDMLRNTGKLQNAFVVHLQPKLRSLIREQGKSVQRAEDFFTEKVQNELQSRILEGMKEYCQPKGLEIQAVLIRDINLPDFIEKAIESKKEREQQAEREKAELIRYQTEQQKLVEQAKAKREAAEEEAATKKILADAEAYQIEKINRAISGNRAYINLKALEALQAISKDGNSKVYFLNGDSPHPLPLMQVGTK